MPSLYENPEQLSEADYNQELYEAIAAELHKQQFETDAFRATARVETGQEVAISDYWTFLNADSRFTPFEGPPRRAALLVGQSVLESVIDNDIDSMIILCRPTLLKRKLNPLTSLLRSFNIDPDTDELIMVEANSGRVGQPWGNRVARLTVTALQNCFFDLQP